MKKLLPLILLLTSLFAREYIAIIDFEGNGVGDIETKALTQRLTSEMIKLEIYQVLERAEMKRLLDVQKFQSSGCVDLKCAVEIGKVLGAKFMVVGSVSKLGSSFSIESRLIDVETSEAYISASYIHKGQIDALLTGGITSIARQLCELEDNPQYTGTSDLEEMKRLKELENQLEALEEERRAEELKADVISLQNLEEQLETAEEVAKKIEGEEFREKLETHKKIITDGKNIWVRNTLEKNHVKLALIGDILEEYNHDMEATILSGEIKNIGNKRADFVRIIFSFRMNWKGDIKNATTYINGATKKFSTGISSHNSTLPHTVGNFELEIPKSFGKFVGYNYDIDWSEYDE